MLPATLCSPSPPLTDIHLRCALVGMPGCGKSTVGRQLALRLGLPFVDMDQRLEQQLGSSIREFFEQHGETAFRKREAALLAELATDNSPLVLSTGGGTVLREDNRAALRQGFAHVLYLRAAPEDLLRRVKNDRNRPLLQVDNPLHRLRDLHEARDALYRAAASHTLATGRPSVTALVNLVLKHLQKSTTPNTDAASPRTS